MRISAITIVLLLLCIVISDKSLAQSPCKGPVRPLLDREDRCSLFVQFTPDDSVPDARIKTNLHLKEGDSARSIAIIFAVSEYPRNPNFSLHAIENDKNNLVTFFRDEQKFDEVIVLWNRDATVDNLRYFLQNYIRQRALYYNGHTRILLAISAHGVQRPSVLQRVDSSIPPSVGIALQNAQDADDLTNIYGLGELLGLLYDVAKDNYHVGVLVNACFGGQIFAGAMAGGNPETYDARGARAMTAGSATNEVATLGGDLDGSVFFDSLINGVRKGEADTPAYIATHNKNVSNLRGIVRWGELVGYIQERVRQVSAISPADASLLNGNSYAWEGSIEPVPLVAEGGFFFTQPLPTDENVSGQVKLDAAFTAGAKEVSFQTLAPTTSQLRRSSIFNEAPQTKVHDLAALRALGVKAIGIDVAHYNGQIDWSKVASQNIKFAYLKATQGAYYVDGSFAKYRDGARSVGLKYGIYHTVSFCDKPEDQAAHIKAVVGDTQGALPMALDIELFSKEQYASNIPALRAQGTCAEQLGVEGQRKLLDTLARLIKVQTGVEPIIYATRYFIETVLTDEEYALWRPQYGVAAGPPPSPWVIWQYSQSGRVDGIGAGVDLDVVDTP